jgi:hypothetical protein
MFLLYHFFLYSLLLGSIYLLLFLFFHFCILVIYLIYLIYFYIMKYFYIFEEALYEIAFIPLYFTVHAIVFFQDPSCLRRVCYQYLIINCYSFIFDEKNRLFLLNFLSQSETKENFGPGNGNDKSDIKESLVPDNENDKSDTNLMGNILYFIAFINNKRYKTPYDVEPSFPMSF